jgi:hypothetical protein
LRFRAPPARPDHDRHGYDDQNREKNFRSGHTVTLSRKRRVREFTPVRKMKAESLRVEFAETLRMLKATRYQFSLRANWKVRGSSAAVG